MFCQWLWVDQCGDWNLQKYWSKLNVEYWGSTIAEWIGQAEPVITKPLAEYTGITVTRLIWVHQQKKFNCNFIQSKEAFTQWHLSIMLENYRLAVPILRDISEDKIIGWAKLSRPGLEKVLRNISALPSGLRLRKMSTPVWQYFPMLCKTASQLTVTGTLACPFLFVL